jgi:hypothetical protein
MDSEEKQGNEQRPNPKAVFQRAAGHINVKTKRYGTLTRFAL